MGESDESFLTRFIYRAGLPPGTFPSPLYVLSPEDQRYKQAADLLEHSLFLVPQALVELESKPELLERYRNTCSRDQSSDEEILSRGVEVIKWIAHFSDGTQISTDYFTSYRPEEVVEIDNNRLNAFLNSVQNHENFNKFEYIEVIHNHVLPDTLSLKDVEYAIEISMAIKSRVMITAVIKDNDKIIEARSAIYNNGSRERD